jgi:hypothetical protein
VEYLEASLTAQDRRILVVQACEVDDDLVRDMTELLTSFCARLYGRRSARESCLYGLCCEILEDIGCPVWFALGAQSVKAELFDESSYCARTSRSEWG